MEQQRTGTLCGRNEDWNGCEDRTMKFRTWTGLVIDEQLLQALKYYS